MSDRSPRAAAVVGGAADPGRVVHLLLWAALVDGAA